MPEGSKRNLLEKFVPVLLVLTVVLAGLVDFSLHHNHLFSVKCLVRNRDGTRSWESDSCYNPADHVYDPNRTQYMDLINSLRDTIRHKQTVK